ncbi:MAG: M23 family metallopeptidase [Terrimicrobiaceae bacterium]|jgi:murein DD-endopeptidase MepM/ murein hydrolase activator NlpD
MTLRLLAAFLAISGAEAALFDFPTKNRALLEGRPEDFFMYVERDFEGEKSHPWQGGQFGFVRGPQRTPQGVAFATLHEGVDIQPLLRDPAGNPLDDVLAAATGRVAHVNKEAGASNYGRYIVVEHRIEGCSIYTLYAHLASTSVTPGQTVGQGEILGRLGYTGAGIDRRRAHVHFEIGILLSENFEAWHAVHFAGTPNKHGLFNGMNLSGTDPAAVLVAAEKDPGFQITKYLAGLEPVFKITFPNSPGLSLLRNYPWLVPNGEIADPPAWTISFTGTGFPVRAIASQKAVAAPELAWVRDSPTAYIHATRGLVGGAAGHPRLTESGQRFANLLVWPPGNATADPSSGVRTSLKKR